MSSAGLKLTHKEIDSICFALMQQIEKCESAKDEEALLHPKEDILKYRSLYKKINQYGMQTND